MFNSGNCASIPLVANIDGCGGNGNNGFAGGWDAWIVIILFALIFGWGNNGWGNNGGNGGGNGAGYAQFVPYQVGSTYTDAAISRGFDHQAVVQKLDGITQGICDSTYALNNTMTNGFAGVNQALCNGFNNTNTAMMQGFNAANVTALQGFNGVERSFCNLSSQLADCCCKEQIGQLQLGNSVERGFCDTNYNAATNTTAIIQNAHNDTDRVLAKLDAMENARKDEKIAEQAQKITALQFAASQADQNAFIAANQTAQTAELIRRLGMDCPVNAVVVQPNTPVSFPTNCCGQFNGWGNGYNNGYGNCGGCNSCGNCA